MGLSPTACKAFFDMEGKGQQITRWTTKGKRQVFQSPMLATRVRPLPCCGLASQVRKLLCCCFSRREEIRARCIHPPEERHDGFVFAIHTGNIDIAACRKIMELRNREQSNGEGPVSQAIIIRGVIFRHATSIF